tara:strand:+ start:1392 stop:2213 length:822 start_codon:yes stop_codon:yes gene_type:complete
MIRKRFGQHWLNDDLILDKIIEAADIKQGDRILEIGPGRGALTSRLLATSASLIYAIELDRDLINHLNKRFSNYNNFILKQGDILNSNLLPSDGIALNNVVANIPYNITGPLLKRLIGIPGCKSKFLFKRLVLLLQKEVAERILAKSGDKYFSAMSIRIQLMAKATSVCDVPPRCFTPKPKVNSKIIILEPLNIDEREDLDVGKELNQILTLAFSSRRKKIRNSIGCVYDLTIFEQLATAVGISLDDRPQQISIAKWLALAKLIKENQKIDFE